MDRTPIYLEKDDEITSVVDKLKSAEGTSLDIVIPKESLMLQSVINIKLLKRQAETLGKEITIVTQDKVGTKLATQIGIPVVAKEGQTPKEVSMSEEERPEFSENDIELKEKEATKTAGAAATAVVAESDEVVGAVDSSTNAQNDKPGKDKKSGGNWLKKHWKGVAIGATFGLLGLMVLAYIYVPIARIEMVLAAEKKAVDISFTAEKEANEVSVEQRIVPAREIIEEIEKKETFQATGEKEIGERASGTVTISDSGYTSKPNSTTLVAGTRLISSNGLTFRLKSNATVPGFETVAGETKPGTVDALVEASEVGEKYNIGATSFTIPALNSSKMTASSSSAMVGGSSKKVKFVTANDITNAKKSVASSSENEAKNKINEALEDGEILLEGAVEYEEISARSSVASGGEATEFEYTVKQKGVGLAFKEADLKSLAEGVLGNEIGENKEIVEADSLITSTKTTDVDTEKGTLEATLAGEAYIATKIDQKDLKNSINGDPEATANEYLSSLEGVDAIQIKFFPNFYKRVPRINNNIHIKVEISKTQSE